MKTAEEKAKKYADDIIYIVEKGREITVEEIHDLAQKDYLAGYNEAMRWRDPKEGLPNRDMQVVIKGGILKKEVGPDIENDYSAGYYYDGVWYVSPTDYSSIEIENPTGWRPIE
ncbi:MAG: hypothetical protein EOM03_13510 [Clostridia bacterium]|nr:hypothetical protein [Clostridia bacterium]